ncbi:hypothetical protein [Chromatocurvus halotolerans]|uniref:Uncharacterized protein n=1 Tax=Chromatocurvus halotolerans TaxID=1132028 RepID=A0A4R2KM25_9GAMM|nr:hypothetical protein [Chromatocurvus halotolerans]TCO73692.1 hypothetical protein EV688_1158 [Chromatocurvus halotolerans]
MTIRSLAEVGARLEEAVALLPGEPDSPQDLYDRYEEMAIAILDSEHADWPAGLLEEYLMLWLQIRRLELGVSEVEVEAPPVSARHLP